MGYSFADLKKPISASSPLTPLNYLATASLIFLCGFAFGNLDELTVKVVTYAAKTPVIWLPKLPMISDFIRGGEINVFNAFRLGIFPLISLLIITMPLVEVEDKTLRNVTVATLCLLAPLLLLYVILIGIVIGLLLLKFWYLALVAWIVVTRVFWLLTTFCFKATRNDNDNDTKPDNFRTRQYIYIVLLLIVVGFAAQKFIPTIPTVPQSEKRASPRSTSASQTSTLAILVQFDKIDGILTSSKRTFRDQS